MSSIFEQIFLLICFSIIINTACADVLEDGEELIISLKNFTIKNGQNTNIQLNESSTILIKIKNIPNEFSFIILQVHTYKYPVLLKYINATKNENYINGTNIGLLKMKSMKTSFTFYLNNFNNYTVSTMVAVIGYPVNAPIPGGCAMESPTEIAPYLDINYENSIITVQCGPADILYTNGKGNCVSNQQLEYTFYHMFMEEDDFTEETYFTSILKMITYDQITENSIVAPEFIIGSPLKRKFSSYSKIGTVYSVVVKSKNNDAVSVYVAAVTFACDITSDNLIECSYPLTINSKLALTLLILYEAFISCRKQFFFELFSRTSMTGWFISYVFLIRNPLVEYDFFLIAAAIGIASGFIWTSICCCYRSPILSYFIPLINFSFLITAITFSICFSDMPYFESDIIYWTVFFTLSITISIICLITYPVLLNNIANWTICSFVIITGIGLLMIESSLPYIVINVVRRATIVGFNEAITVMPFQTKDKILSIIACVIFAFRLYKYSTQTVRLPFPPLSRLIRFTEMDYSDERRTLI